MNAGTIRFGTPGNSVCLQVIMSANSFVCLTRGALPSLGSLPVPQPQTRIQYSYMFRSLTSIIHPGGHTVPSKARSKPQARRAHGEVGNEVPDKGYKLAERCNECQEEVVELYVTRTDQQLARVMDNR